MLGWGVPYYVVFDPLQQFQKADEMGGVLLKVWALMAGRYAKLNPPLWLDMVGLDLTLWDGEFEGQQDSWLRWCNLEGQLVYTGAEDRDREHQRAKRLTEQLRQMGVNPEEI